MSRESSELTFNIAGRRVGGQEPAFIIAELSANHGQKLEVAVKTIEAAKEAGADAIKLQTYTPDTMTLDCRNEFFSIHHGTPWDGKTLYELYKEAYTPWEWQPELKAVAEKLGLICFSTPFDATSVDFLETLNVPAYKIASFELCDIPLLAYVAQQGKPVVISAGLACYDDIDLAVQTLRANGCHEVAVLKCTSAYPAPIEEANLRTLTDMQRKFNCVVGLSDHTLGTVVSTTAVALGAKIIEKHFILDRALGGPDAMFSINPYELKQLVDNVRTVEKALGCVSYKISDNVEKNRIFSRSLFVVEDMDEGEVFTAQNLRSIRPGYGAHPKYYANILGKRAVCSIVRGTPLEISMVKGGAD